MIARMCIRERHGEVKKIHAKRGTLPIKIDRFLLSPTISFHYLHALGVILLPVYYLSDVYSKFWLTSMEESGTEEDDDHNGKKCALSIQHRYGGCFRYLHGGSVGTLVAYGWWLLRYHPR